MGVCGFEHPGMELFQVGGVKMGNKRESFYSGLSRGELQKLCKKHGLSAIGTNARLAKSLFNFLKGKNAFLSSSEGYGSSSHVGDSHQSQASNLPPKELLNHLEAVEIDRRGIEASDADSCKQSTCLIKKEDRTHFQNTLGEIRSYADSYSSEMVSDHTVDVAHDFSTINESKEEFGCSTSGTINVEGQSSSHYKNSDLENSPNPRPSCFGGASSQLQFQHTNNETDSHINAKRTKQCQILKESSSQLPPLQFFVESEKGIDILVDLSSSPSNWIMRLKDELHCCQSAHYESLYNCSKDCNESSETSLRSLDTMILSRRLNKRHMPLLTTVKETTPVASPKETGVELSAISEQDKKMSLYGCDNAVQMQIGSHEGSGSQFLDSSLIKCTHNLDKKSNAAKSIFSGALEDHVGVNLECAIAHSKNISYLVSNLSEKTGTSEGLPRPSTVSFEKFAEERRGSSASCSYTRQLLRNTGQGEDVGSKSGFDTLRNSLRYEKKCLSSHLHDKAICGLEEQVRSSIANETESSVCSQLGRSLDATSKRTCPKYVNVLQPKKKKLGDQVEDFGDAESLVIDSRNAKITKMNRLPPQRSKRLNPKDFLA